MTAASTLERLRQVRLDGIPFEMRAMQRWGCGAYEDRPRGRAHEGSLQRCDRPTCEQYPARGLDNLRSRGGALHSQAPA